MKITKLETAIKLSPLQAAIELSSYSYCLLNGCKHCDLVGMHADKEDEIIKSQCTIVPSNMDDVTLYALPGREADMSELGQKMKKKIKPLRVKKVKTFRCDK